MTALLDRLSAGWRPYLLLTLLCALFFVPGQTSLPSMDRDESRFIQASRQMMETGDFVRIRFQDKARNKKPAGIHWLQVASVQLFAGGDTRAVWAYRLPSAGAAWLVVLLVFRFGRDLFSPRAALMGAGILGGTLLLGVEAHQAKTDATLLLATVAAQGALARVYCATRPGAPALGRWAGVGLPLLFWFALGVGIMIKGPVVPMVAALTLLALGIGGRDARWLLALNPLPGVLVTLAVAVPWFVAISATKSGFLEDSVGKALLPKLLSSVESHGAPPGTYLLQLPVMFWAGSLFVVGGAWHAWRHRRENAALRVLVWWALPAWIMFELIPTKLPHYPLPTYPALALAAGAWLAALVEGRAAPAGRLWPGVWMLLGVVLAAVLTLVTVPVDLTWTPWLLLPATLALATTAVAGTLWWRRRVVAAWAAAVVLGGLVPMTTISVALPHVDDMWLAQRSAAAVAAATPANAPPPVVAVTGFHEPSMVEALGTPTRLVTGPQAARLLAEGTVSLALVDTGSWPAFVAALGRTPPVLAEISGFDYTNGDPLTLRLVRLPAAMP